MAKDPIHPLFQLALKGMHQSYQHLHPIHLDGPPPRVRRRDQVSLVQWCAGQLLPLINDPDRRRAVEDLLRLVGRVTEGPVGESELDEVNEGLDRGNEFNEPDAASVAGLAANAAEHLLRGKPRNIPRGVRIAIMRTMALLVRPKKIEGVSRPKEFLVALDDWMVRAEFSAVARRYSDTAAARLRAVLYRGGDQNDTMAVWLVALDTGYGLLARLGPRLKWLEGGRDEILATVPEAHFEAATSALFHRTAGG